MEIVWHGAGTRVDTTMLNRSRPWLTSLFGTVISFSLFMLRQSPAGAETKQGSTIEIWARGTDRPDQPSSRHERSSQVNLDKARLQSAERYDAQYARAGRYRGIPVKTLLDRYAPDRSLDLAILHFANGMAVPLPFRDEIAMKRLSPFIARGGRFPAIPKKEAPFDRRPIQFSGNKLVVADSWHPDVLPESQPAFSPWTHVDTLVGIEIVSAASYYAQFEAGGEARVGRGLTLFRQSCQFCHGVHQIGATFGWDFADSPAISDYEDSAANLYHNVAYKPRNAGELGLMMPPLSFLSEAAAGDVRQWLQAVGGLPRPPYERPQTFAPRPVR